ncbi:hypothetical protein [Serratia silvae]|nr:hypothetical protein [Serratia silvae]
MKKTIISGAVMSVMMLSMGTAMAGSMSSELSVKGKMAIPSCKVYLKDDGVFNLGKISHGVIKSSAATPMREIMGSLNVVCDADTYLKFSAVDNREGTASTAGSTHFGLGNVNGKGKLGYYTMKLSTAKVDGAESGLYSTQKGSTSTTAYLTATIDKGKVTGWADDNNTQVSGKLFQANLAIEPVLASTKDMAGSITENTKLDGSATLNFSYGL